MTKRGKRYGTKHIVQVPRTVVNLPGWKEAVKTSKNCDWTKLSPEFVEEYHDKEKINKLINEIVFDPQMRRYTNEIDPDFLKRLDNYAQRCAERQNCKLVLDEQQPSTSAASLDEQAQAELELAKWKAKKRAIRRLATGKSFAEEEKEVNPKESDSESESDDDEVFLPGADNGHQGNKPGSSGAAPGISCA